MNHLEKINSALQTTHLVNQIDVNAAPILLLRDEEHNSIFDRSIHQTCDELSKIA